MTDEQYHGILNVLINLGQAIDRIEAAMLKREDLHPSVQKPHSIEEWEQLMAGEKRERLAGMRNAHPEEAAQAGEHRAETARCEKITDQTSLTVGKRYPIIGWDGAGFSIKCDSGAEIFCLPTGCAHIDGDWIIEPAGEQREGGE